VLNQSKSLMCWSQPCNETVQWTIGRLIQGGLQVLRTFDFEGARGVDTSCTCTCHGTDRCDCQVVILLVYDKDGQPLSLMVHGHDGKTWVNLVESFQPNNSVLEMKIRKLLTRSDNRTVNNEQSLA
jgi:hypothetical protein